MSTKERHAIFKNKGLCPNCSKPSDKGHTFCPKCREKSRLKYFKNKYPDGCKKCLDCNKIIPVGSKRTPDRCPECLHSCNLGRARSYYSANPDKKQKVRNYYKERYHNNRDKIREQRRKTDISKRYGIDYGDFLDIIKYQNGKCAICGTNLPDIDTVTKTRKLAFIDHNHATGKIRGVLCPSCNFGLGNFKDDINVLEGAIQYLVNNM